MAVMLRMMVVNSVLKVRKPRHRVQAMCLTDRLGSQDLN